MKECLTILGMEAKGKTDVNGKLVELTLHNSSKIIQLIQDYPQILNLKPQSVPVLPSFLNGLDDKNKSALIPKDLKKAYHSIVGRLMYVSLMTRPDVTYAIGYLSRYVAEPTIVQWKILQQLLGYLVKTTELGICYKTEGNKNLVQVFTDANFGTIHGDGHDTSGVVCFIGNNLVSWSSKKQTQIAQSTLESEGWALKDGVQEGLWLKEFLQDIGMHDIEMVVHCDNQGLIFDVSSGFSKKRTKYLRKRFLYMHEELELKKYQLEYVQSKKNLADVLTKPLHKMEFIRIRNQLMTTI
jgi:hypothetical protein